MSRRANRVPDPSTGSTRRGLLPWGLLVAGLVTAVPVRAAEAAQVPSDASPPTRLVPLQPLAQHARLLERALSYLGQPLAQEDHDRINRATAATDEAAACAEIEAVLDRHVLLVVAINPESRVKVTRGPALAELVEAGSRLFLVKVLNEAGVTSPLTVASPNSGAVSTASWSSDLSPEPPVKVTAADVRERWADISLYQKPPMSDRLSGLGLEYQILEVGSRERGQRSAQIAFSVGQGTQDIGFRNDASVLFEARPAHQVTLRVRDERGEPTVASLLVRDSAGHTYPSPSKRLAPDLPFQSQVYRADGERLALPAGSYAVTWSRGPEYLRKAMELKVDGPAELAVELERWIDPAKLGWYSGDHHIHAAGCSHYDNPTQGVSPLDMWRQVEGEALNVGSVLTWGPCYYHQKRHFSGQDHPVSKPGHLVHYDLEVSGFPSSHAGHIVLLGLRDQDYPGTTRIEHWPSWDLPILRWAKGQGAVTGFAHSGFGLAVAGTDLPSYEMPAFDGIGANEYVVDVTHDAVDFISAGDTSHLAELNIWYHTLNVGFRTRISGETDFPCLTDDRVGEGRTYVKLDGPLTYRGFIEGIRAGRSYVSDGRSHLMDFSVNGTEVGTAASEVRLDREGPVRIALKVSARLPESPDEELRSTTPGDFLVQFLGPVEKPYWDLRRARIGKSREVPIEIVVNGRAVARRHVVADGTVQNVELEAPVGRSSWIAARILPSSHTNPIFVIVGGKPVRASARSAQWCLDAVGQCWSQKRVRTTPADLEAARSGYEHARQVYRRLLAESQTE
jgi:hypothetical protein